MTAYFDYVNSLSGQFPRLKVLADFMSPNIRINGYHSESNVNQRLHKVDVRVVDVENGSKQAHSYDDLKSLTNHLDNTKQGNNGLRVILVEDVSAAVIELLGSKYKLDPRFFENHVRGICTFLADKWDGDKKERLESPMAEVLSRGFLMVNFSRLYALTNWDLAWEARSRVNVPRWANMVRSLCLQENASIYGPIKNPSGSVTYIVLCDPLLDADLPAAIHLRDNDKVPKFDPNVTYEAKTTESKQTSTRSAIEAAILESAFHGTNAVGDVLIKSVINVAMGFHASVIEELSLRRYRLDSNYYNRPKQSYQIMLHKFHLSGGWLNLHRYTGKSLLNIKSVGINYIVNEGIRHDLNLEIEAIEIAHERAHWYMTQVLDFLKSEQQIEFTKSVERLTTITFLFLPFSTMATILSINDTMRFGVFFALAVPILVICIAVGIHGKSLSGLAVEIQYFIENLVATYRTNKPSKASATTEYGQDVEAVSTKMEFDQEDFREKVFEAKVGHDKGSMMAFVSESQFRRRTNTRKNS